MIEKASTIGAHILSGAVIEPGPLDALLPGWRDDAAADLRAGDRGRVLAAHEDRRHASCRVPPQMHNHGNFIVSLGAMCAWLAPQAEALGVEIYPGFAAAETLHDDGGRVVGVRIGDMGVDARRLAQARATRRASTSARRSPCSPKARAGT